MVPPEVVELLQCSKNTLIQELFQLKRSHIQESDGTRAVSVLRRFNELKYYLIMLEVSHWFLRRIATENQENKASWKSR